MPTLECPICRRTVIFDALEQVPCRPFCSLRCQRIDLARWLNEEYRISEEVPDTAEAPPEDPSEDGDEGPDR